MKKMKKFLTAGALLGLSMGLSLAFGETAEATSTPIVNHMHRLYNKNSGEHFYTADGEEKDHLVKVGWLYEGIGWVAPNGGQEVYRLYNPNAGDHHYTMSVTERDMLVSFGWRYEGVGWYSDTDQTVPLYRAYNPYAKTGTHNYTVSSAEQNHLLSLGWLDEGIAWYGIAVGEPIEPETPVEPEVPVEPEQPDPGEEASLQAMREEIVSLVNQERAKLSRSSLQANANLQTAADARAKELVQTFDHSRPNGQEWHTIFNDLGLSSYFASLRAAGENIQGNFGALNLETAANINQVWADSPGHFSNMVSEKFSSIGVGLYVEGGRIYAVELFGG